MITKTRIHNGFDAQNIREKTHQFFLVGGFNPFEKYYIVKMEIFPK